MRFTLTGVPLSHLPLSCRSIKYELKMCVLESCPTISLDCGRTVCILKLMLATPHLVQNLCLHQKLNPLRVSGPFFSQCLSICLSGTAAAASQCPLFLFLFSFFLSPVFVCSWGWKAHRTHISAWQWPLLTQNIHCLDLNRVDVWLYTHKFYGVPAGKWRLVRTSGHIKCAASLTRW